MISRKIKILVIVLGSAVLLFYLFSIRPIPSEITYGVSFSKFHSDELKLDWKKVYMAILDDLKAKNVRLSAHWPMVEPSDGRYNFSELDFQMQEAQKRGASVILAVGRRLPGWPECHEPAWLASRLSTLNSQQEAEKFRQEKLLEYIMAVVNRYKSFGNIKHWQVENEPFLTFFGRSKCGSLDEDFFKEEINLVRRLDPGRPVLVTDSGEFGTWYKAHKYGDIFGTTMYLYVWNRIIGPLRYPITPAFFRVKQNIVETFLGKKPSLVIELSAEPWLLKPIVETPMETLLKQMNVSRFNEIIDFSGKTGFDTFYLWGAEWWYWMKTKQNHPEFWERAKELF